MLAAHAGFALTIVGAVFVTQFSAERDLRMEAGDTVELNGYTFELTELVVVEGPNYAADRGVFAVTYDGESLSSLMPEKRRYVASGQIMTEAAIDAGAMRDLYIALGEPLGDGAWSVRVQHKPLNSLDLVWRIDDRFRRFDDRARSTIPESICWANGEGRRGTCYLNGFSR